MRAHLRQQTPYASSVRRCRKSAPPASPTHTERPGPAATLPLVARHARQSYAEPTLFSPRGSRPTTQALRGGRTLDAALEDRCLLYSEKAQQAGSVGTQAEVSSLRVQAPLLRLWACDVRCLHEAAQLRLCTLPACLAVLGIRDVGPLVHTCAAERSYVPESHSFCVGIRSARDTNKSKDCAPRLFREQSAQREDLRLEPAQGYVRIHLSHPSWE